jgi:transcriptional regulator with XRE-family HTH domain
MDDSERVAAHLARNLVSLRRARSLTQDTLAKAAGVPRSTIANLESGQGNPSLAVLIKVVNALGAPVDELLAPPHAKVRHWPAGEIPRRSLGRGVRVRPLVPEPVPEEMLTIMEFAPKGSMRGTPHLPGTREFFTCLRGRVTIFVAGARHDLNEGDVLAFPGNVAHFYQNPDNQQPAHGVSVVILAKAGV